MSTTVVSSPFTLGWARNRNSYRLHCNFLDSAGSRHYVYCNRSASIPAVGNHVVVAIDGTEYVFTIVATSTGNAYDVASKSELFDKIRGCWYVQQVFNIPSSNNDATHLSMVAKEVGYHKFEIFCTNADGNRTGYESTMLTWTLNGGGVDRQEKPNYAIAVELEVVVNNNNQLKTHLVKGLVFQPDGAGDVEIPLDALPGFISQPDIPTTNPTTGTWDLLTNMLLKYRVSYGEMWGEEVPLVQNWTTTAYKYALCGEMADRFARLNLPDWRSNETQFSETNNYFRILGEDNGDTIRICRSQAEYIYGMWFDTTLNISTTRNITLSVSVDGGTAVTTTKQVQNGQLYRIPVGLAALGITEAKYYTVSLSLGGHTWSRTFVVQPDYFEPTALLLQNKYGLLRSFTVPRVRRDITTEAEELLVDHRRYLNITEGSEAYTVTTAQMTRKEARRLAQCIGQQYQYVKCGTAWLRITIEAGSFKVLDEAEDLVTLEFAYRFVENQTEDITNGSLDRSVTVNRVDFGDNLVAFYEGTIPNNNEIL